MTYGASGKAQKRLRMVREGYFQVVFVVWGENQKPLVFEYIPLII